MNVENRLSMSRLAPLLLLLSCSAVGCGIPLDGNPGFGGCTEDNEDTVCDVHEMCHRGFCVSAACEGDDTVECYTVDGPDGGQPAITGICRTGTRACIDGVFGACRGQVLPGIETCNGLNDDCDEATDELPQASCETGQQGACNAGMPACQGADVVCRRSVNPSSEVCDDVDNDCAVTRQWFLDSASEFEHGYGQLALEFNCRASCANQTAAGYGYIHRTEAHRGANADCGEDAE